MLYNKALIFLLVRQHFSARSIFSLRSRSQVLINIPPQFDEGQEKVILSCSLSSHVVTCYDAKSGGLRIEIDRRLLPSIWCKWAFTFVRPSLNPENVCQVQHLKIVKGFFPTMLALFLIKEPYLIWTSYKIGFLTIFEFTNQILLSTLEIKVQDLQIMMLEKGKGNETL